MGHSVSRLRDFTDYDMESPYTHRRPSSHTAFIPEPGVTGDQLGASPSHRARGYTEPHLPSFHHDHLHHAGQEMLGVSTLQPNTQRRERAREALLRRGCDGQQDPGGSVDSGDTVSHSGSSRTTENPTEQTVVIKHQLGPPQAPGQPQHGGQRLVPGVKVHLSSHSLHSLHSVHSHHSVHNVHSVGLEEEQNSDDQLSSEDNLSHESYDLLDKEQAAAHAHYNSDTLKTVLSYDNSPYTPSKIPGLEQDSNYRDDLINSNLNIHAGSKPASHSSTYSSRQSVNSSGLSASPLPDQGGAGQCVPQSILSRRRSSGTLSQKSKSSKDSIKSEPKSEPMQMDARIILREGHFLSEDHTDDFQGHEIHMSSRSMTSSPGQPLYDSMTNKNHQGQTGPGHGMHENILFQSPTNTAYFSGHIHGQPMRGLESRTLPNRKRRDKSPAVFTTGKLSVDCSSASSSSHASPRISRPKSLDFSVVALQDLPQSTAYSYRDDTIDQQDFEENSSSTVSQGQNNYASSSDVAATPEVPATAARVTQHQSSRASHISQKPIQTFNSSKHTSLPFAGLNQERIYDIPEGIERDEFGVELQQPIRGRDQATRQPPQPQPRTIFQNLTPISGYKNYREMSRKFSSEDSESIPSKPKLKIFPPPLPRSLKKVSSTESESAISGASGAQSLPPVPGFDSDTLSLPLDLISPPLESENSTDLVDSESLPAPPQFGSSKDDTDIEDEVTPRGEELVTSEAADLNGQPEKSKFGFRVAPLALQNIELIPPTRQESTYETRAERVLEAQLSRTDTFKEAQHLIPHPHPPHLQHGLSREIIDLDKELTNGKNPVLDNILLKALDSYDSFNNDPIKIDSRENSLTYEENAESALEKQTTIESFTSQISADNDVFYDQGIENKVQELSDPNFTNRRDQILESQSTFESFTTECEVLVTKRQESTYEERAETVLESQNTIESFTNEVPNDEVFDHEPPLSESSFLHDEDCETQIEAGRGGADLVADMLVRQLARGGEEELLDSLASAPFMDDTFDQDLALLSGTGARLACGQGDRILYNNFVRLPGAEREAASEPHSAASASSPIYVEPTVTRSDSASSFEVTPGPGGGQVETEERGQMTDCLDFTGPGEPLTGPYDTEPPPPLPPDEFGTFTVPHEPLYYRADGFRGSFPMRTLSR